MIQRWHPLQRCGYFVFILAVAAVSLSCGQNEGQVADNVDRSAASPDPPVDFGRDIQPIFEGFCYSCHGAERQESNYRLDVRSLALGEGDFGDAPIVAGQVASSPLIQYVSARVEDDQVMPPAEQEKRLDRNQVELLRRWVAQGAVWPDELAGKDTGKLTTDHWSFQPIAKATPPPFKRFPDAAFQARNEIDHFIARRLSEEGMLPSSPADRVSLIRRVYLVMHGLQPTPAQVKSFVEETSPQAYEKVINDVLGSHHYGERWARHWLDVVRFGESTGYEVNRDRANAYYYRDYVIDALNSDKPYRDFVIEQLAGDAVGVDEATGFLVGGPNDIVKSPDVNLTLMQREDELADYVNTTSTAFLGLTVGCARCHNHKFDPILQRDYYSLQAIFAGVEHGERKLLNQVKPELIESIELTQIKLGRLEKQLDELRLAAPQRPASEAPWVAVNPKLNVDAFDPVEAKFLRFEIRRTNQSEPCIDELEVFSADGNVNMAHVAQSSIATSSGDYSGNAKHKLEHLNDGKYGNDFSWISNSQGTSWVQIEFKSPIVVNRVEWARDRNGTCTDRLAIDYSISVSTEGDVWKEVSSSRQRQPFSTDGGEPADAFIANLSGEEAVHARGVLDAINNARVQIEKQNQSIPIGYVGTFGTPKPIHRLYRGDPRAPRELVMPDVLTVMGTLGMDNDTPEQDRRMELAQWIVSTDNPLTARVIVNRVWHYHFGTGLVSTPSDFGKNGGLPSHPELLDWLAQGLMENNWSLKWLHREILGSSTFRQSSRPRSAALSQDADCRLLWRFPPRRLEAEAIRDCILQVSGQLNPKAGGPGFLLFRVDRENVHHYFPLEKFEPEHFRRMIYMTKIRQERDEVFGVFDCPDGGQAIPNRNRSTTALQALSLFNSRFMIEQSAFLAERLRGTSGENESEQVTAAFELVFSRSPTPDELTDAVGLVKEHGLESFCRALLNASEFLFVS